MSEHGLSAIEFGSDGLVPAVIRDATSGEVLMTAFMNVEALTRTRESGLVHFWSRSRQQIWQKGETSGHVQRVQAIFVNCDRNSLLIDVEQTGAVCHDGYPTCYYRRLEPDGTLTVVRDRWFDPADIYGSGTQQGIAALTARQFGAYVFLQTNDLSAQSRTSSMLRQPGDQVTARLAGELDELAGAIEGTHRHVDRRSDIVLEAGQVLYWALLTCVRHDVSWDEVRPDRALDIDASDEQITPRLLAETLRQTGQTWRTPKVNLSQQIASDAHATLNLVAQACVANGIAPKEIVERDLAELRTRPYLDAYFDSAATR